MQDTPSGGRCRDFAVHFWARKKNLSATKTHKYMFCAERQDGGVQEDLGGDSFITLNVKAKNRNKI